MATMIGRASSAVAVAMASTVGFPVIAAVVRLLGELVDRAPVAVSLLTVAVSLPQHLFWLHVFCLHSSMQFLGVVTSGAFLSKQKKCNVMKRRRKNRIEYANCIWVGELGLNGGRMNAFFVKELFELRGDLHILNRIVTCHMRCGDDLVARQFPYVKLVNVNNSFDLFK